MAASDRGKTMSSIYGSALTELRHRHDAEFHEILDDLYAKSGLEVKRRLTGERKRQADIARAKAVLASLEQAAEQE